MKKPPKKTSAKPDTPKRKTADPSVRAQKRFQALVENSAIAITLLDANGVAIYDSPAAPGLLGYAPEEWIGHNVFELLHPEDAEGVIAKFMALAQDASQPLQSVFRMRHGSGKWVWIDAHGANLLADPDVEAIVINYRDITAQKQAEEERRRAHALLGERVKELTTLHRASQVMQRQHQSPSTALQEIAALIPAGWQFPEITAAQITFEDLVCASTNFATSPWRMAVEFETRDYKRGTIEVVYLEEPPPTDNGPFLKEERALLETLAEMVGVYLDRYQAESQTHRHFGQLTAINKISESITSHLEVNFQVVLEQAVIHLGIDAAWLLLLNEDKQRLEPAAVIGFRLPPPVSIPLQNTLAGKAVATRRPILKPNAMASLFPDNDGRWQKEGFCAYFANPLVLNGKVKGVLEVFQRQPFEPDDEWLSFLDTLAQQAAVAVDNHDLVLSLQNSNLELIQAYDVTLEGWSHAMDLRDRETEGHTQRVTEMTLRLAQSMGLAEESRAHIRRGALLHDVGKLGIPDSILLKPEALNDEEWKIMRMHPVYAYEWLSPIEVLRPALDIPYAHHEKWDGSGYPRGLQGEEIPLAARIFAVVDVWDALRSDRPYRPAWKQEKVLAYLTEQSGSHFDPEIVAAFVKTFSETISRP